jgi:hypothetical protein
VPLEAADNTLQTWRALQSAITILEHTIRVTGPGARMPRSDEVEMICWAFGDGSEFDEEAASYAAQQEYYESGMREYDE